MFSGVWLFLVWRGGRFGFFFLTDTVKTETVKKKRKEIPNIPA